MSSLLRRRPLPRGRIDRLEPTTLGRDVRAVHGPVVRSGGLLRILLGVVRVVTLIVVDTAAVSFAIYAGLAIKDWVARGTVLWGLLWRVEAAWLPFITLVLVLVFARAGLYRTRLARPGASVVIASLALTAVIVAAFARVTGHPSGTYAIWLWTLVTSGVLIPTLRGSFDIACGLVAAAVGHTRRVVIVGDEAAAAALTEALSRDNADSGLDVAERVASIADLAAALERVRVDDVVLARIPEDDAVLLDAVEACARHGVHLLVVPSATRLLAREAAFLPGRSLPLFQISPPTIEGLDWLLKRAFDLLVAGVVLVVLSPLLAVIALLIKLTSPGPVFYRDERIGIGERPFAMLKFRSMHQHAAHAQQRLEAANEADGALFKIRDDPRLTRVGRVTRRLSLDELPQLVNVLRGEMSLVGPRPLPMRDYALLEAWHRKRYLVLPGITGLWQTSGRSNLQFDDMVRLDFYYLEHWSIWLDITILARTPLAVVTGRGAF